MLSTRQAVFRKFWYATVSMDALRDGSKPFRHIIFNRATPIDDGSMQVVQIPHRNCAEADCATQAEDCGALESTDPDTIFDIGRQLEMQMPSERAGMIMRGRLFELLQSHGETEIAR